MGDHERWINFAVLDAPGEVVGPTIHVRLAHAKRETFIHRGAERHFVDKTSVNARNRERPPGTTYIDHLTQNVRPIGFKHQRLFHPIVHPVDGARDVRLHSHCVNAFFWTFAVR